MLIGSLVVTRTWTQAAGESIAELSRTQLVSRIQEYRRWIKKAHPYYVAINLIALWSVPVVGFLSKQGLIPRGVLKVWIVGGGLTFSVNQIAVVLVPRALARRLKLYCPNCRHLLGPGPQQLKSARRGECSRCGVQFPAAEPGGPGDVRPGSPPE